jgi:hypothetical protein
MSERVFRATYPASGNTYEVRFPDGCTRATAKCIDGPAAGSEGTFWSPHNLDSHYVEVTPPPAELLPSTTADLHTELAAFKQFATAITASFGDDSKRNHQMDFQHAYDGLHKSIQSKGT